jgi:uncharacterized protein
VPPALSFSANVLAVSQAARTVVLIGPTTGSGLYFLPVEHEGNQNCSAEEARAVGTLVRGILESKASWVDREGQEKLVTLDDIVIISPYNAQVFEIQQCLPGARVGTVINFRARKHRSRSILGPPQATLMRREGWNSSTASTA